MSMFCVFDGRVTMAKQELPPDLSRDMDISFEGEILNRAEVISALQLLGCTARTGSDAEVVTLAYREWGEDSLKRFNGSFSFCIHDKRKEILFVVRDHVGLRRLFYSTECGKFVCSSEIKPIIILSGFSREIDIRALNLYFAFRYIPEDLTIFKHVKKLSAGGAIRFDLKSRNLQKWKYWEAPKVESKVASEDDLLEELEEIIKDSIRLRMKGDASIGAYLSGGLDSSLIVALMSKQLSSPLKTFSVGYRGGKYNETKYSRSVSKYFSTDHSEFIAEPDIDSLIKSITCFDEPFSDPSIIPMYHAVKLAKERVDAVMSGDGADALFLGLRTHDLTAGYEHFQRFAVPPLTWISDGIAGVLPDGLKLKTFLKNRTPEDFFLSRRWLYSASQRKQLLKDSVLEELGENFYEPEMQAAAALNSYEGSLKGKMGYATFMSDPDDIFFKVDKLSKKFSLTPRTPFLDKRVVEFALSKVPGSMKIKDGVTKYLLKRMARKYLPSDFPFERKRGFNPPLSNWLNREWQAFARDILLSDDGEFFQKSYIERILKKHKSPIFDEGRRIFSILVFKIWEKKYVKGEGL